MLLKHSSFGISLGVAYVNLRLSALTAAHLLSHRTQGTVGLIHGKVFIFKPSALVLGERVFWQGLYIACIRFFLNYIGTRTHNPRSWDQGLQAREPWVVSSVSEWEFIAIGYFRFQIRVVLRTRGSSPSLRVVCESRLEADSGAGRPFLTEMISFNRVKVLILSVVVIVFGLIGSIFALLGTNNMGRGTVVIILISDFIVRANGFFTWLKRVPRR